MSRLTALSGFDVKGPACFLLEIGGRRLLLDLGEGPDRGRRPDLTGIGPIDAILVSHAHADHAAALDLAAMLGQPPIHATAPVRALAPQPRLKTAIELPLNGKAVIAGIEVETGPAGHAPGAVWMRIGGPEGLVYTGDISAESTLFPSVPPLPATALVFDASYGDAGDGLAGQIAALAALAAQGPLLLPAPAGGRALEMAVALIEAGQEVALCPATREVARLLRDHPATLASDMRHWPGRLLGECAALKAESPARGVMIAASANADKGMAAALARRFAATGEAAIVFTGHLALGSPAPDLVASGRARFLRWNVHPNLEGIRAILAAVAPRLALPAFVPSAGRRALASALAPFPLVEDRIMTW